MTTAPPDVDPAIVEAMKATTFATLHPALIKAAAEGTFTILRIFDSVPWFRTGANWLAWRSFLCALYALPMTDEELAIYRKCTGRQDPPTEKAEEVWLIAGRRARKSAIESLIGVFEGGFFDYTEHMAPGERARIPVLARNMADATQIMSYAKALLSDDALSYLLEDEPSATLIKLRTRVDIEIRAATILAGRTRASPCALFDELAFFQSDDSANPDKEIVRGVEPSMMNMPRRLLMGASSPYARKGLLWEKYDEHFGKPGKILVWVADTLAMHDTALIRAYVAKAYEDDPISAAAEVGAQFRKDVEEFVSVEALKACTVVGRFELAPDPKKHYFGFVDPSGGSADAFAGAVAHWEGPVNEPLKGKAVLDAIKQTEPPFSPESSTKDLCENLFRRYGVTYVTGDAYAGEWPREKFQHNKIAYHVSEESKSEIYSAWLPEVNSTRVELLDIKRLRAQALQLERRVASQGREIIDHPPGAHDDAVNVVAGALLKAMRVGLHLKPKKEAPPKPQTTMDQFKMDIQKEMKARHRTGKKSTRRYPGRNW